MTCIHCDGTGSLSKELHGMLDCGHCGAAQVRVEFNNWAQDLMRQHDPIICLWLAFQRGRALRPTRFPRLVDHAPIKSERTDLTAQEKAEQEQYIKTHNLPF